MNEIQQNLEMIKEGFAAEILKAKARFIHICLAAIMPKDLYDLAAADNQIAKCEAWAKREGYQWEEGPGETRLRKGELIVARFRPILKGSEESCRCVFYANVLGKTVNVAFDNPLLN